MILRFIFFIGFLFKLNASENPFLSPPTSPFKRDTFSQPEFSAPPSLLPIKTKPLLVFSPSQANRTIPSTGFRPQRSLLSSRSFFDKEN